MSVSGDEWFPDHVSVLDEDLAAFVREEDRERSLTVVREIGDPDIDGRAKRWVAKLRKDNADVDACSAMQIIVDRHADGSREEQRAGIVAAIRFDERGHVGLAAALDALFGVRSKDPRDFWRMVESARRVVLHEPTPASEKGCSCPGGFEKIERPERPEREDGEGETGNASDLGGQHGQQDEDDEEGPDFEARKRRRLVEARANAIEVEEEARRLVAQRRRADRPSIRSRLIDVRDLCKVPPPAWLIKGLVPKAGVGFLAGKYGTYKSFVAVSLACYLAQGKAWQGRDEWAVAEPVRVLYVAAEGASGVAERVQAWEHRHGEIAAGQLVVHPEPIRLNDPADVAELTEIVEEDDYGLVIVDTFHRSAPGVEENSSTEVGLILEAMAGIRDRFGTSALFVDHTGHAGKTMRGSTSKGDDADYALLIDLPGDERTSDQQRTLRVAKLKDKAQDGAWPLRLVDVPEIGEDGSAYVEIGEVGARDGEDEVFGDRKWWTADVELPEKVATLKGRGSTVAIDIFRVLAYGQPNRKGMTKAEIVTALKERGGKVPERTVVHRALGLLDEKGITTEGEKPSGITLRDCPK